MSLFDYLFVQAHLDGYSNLELPKSCERGAISNTKNPRSSRHPQIGPHSMDGYAKWKQI